MKRPSLRATVISILVFVMILKFPMRQTPELSNLYSIIMSIAMTIVIILYVLWDSFDDAHLKNNELPNQSDLKKYRTLSISSALMFALQEALDLYQKSRNGYSIIGDFLLVGAIVAMSIRSRYAQGAQTKQTRTETAIYLVIILVLIGARFYFRQLLS